jgi:cell division protein FtsL
MRALSLGERRKGWVVLLFLAMLLGCAGAIAQTWTNLRAIEYGYAISKATTQRARLRESNRQLRVELALLKNPVRIAESATAAGLRPPEPQQVRRLALPPRGAPTRASTAAHEE